MRVEIGAAGGLELPPLLRDFAITADTDPLAAARQAAQDGVDAGAVLWAPRDDRIETAMIFAPDHALSTALTATFAIEQAATDAIGALGPPETAALWAWPDVLLLNGARVGRLRVAASTNDLNATPDWLIFALSIRRAPLTGAEEGERPNETSLLGEGVMLDTKDLIAAFARHALYRITSWDEDGLAAIMREWRGRAEGAETDVRIELGPEAPLTGRWLGLDEEGALLLKTEAETTRLTLSRVLDPTFAAPEVDPLDRAAALTKIGASAPMGGQALKSAR